MTQDQRELVKHIIIELKKILSNKFGVDKCRLKDQLTGDVIEMCSDDHKYFTGLIENRFDIFISLDEAEDIYTLKDAVFYIWARIEEVPKLDARWKDVIQRWFGKKDCSV